MKVTQALATKLARHAPHTTSDNLREWLDIKTGGELEFIPLHILTDMVQAIVKAPLTRKAKP